MPHDPKVNGVVGRLREAGHEAFLVGGCVRDLILGREPEDYDVVTSAKPDEVAALFEKTVAVGAAFGVTMVALDGETIEVATFRAEGPYLDGRRPSEVRFATAREDVLRRDFTVNGLLMDPVSGEVVDYVGGRADIERRTIRTIGEPDRRFGEDHLRLLRAVRFAANLDFDIEPLTSESITRNARLIERISAERIREELDRILTRGRARRGLELMSERGLLEPILPEIEAMRGCEQPARFHPEGDVWEHTLRMLAMLPRGTDRRLAWGALLHDVGKPPTRREGPEGVVFHGHAGEGERIAGEILRRLRLPNDDVRDIMAMVHHHMDFMNVPRMRPNTLKRFLRMSEFGLHLELHRLDCAASHGMLDNYELCRRTLEEMDEEELRPPRLVTGDDLIAMGFRPGPLFAEILEAVEDRQLEGDIAMGDEAREYVLSNWGGLRRT